MTDPADIPDRMAELQKMRMATILTTSAETSKLLSRRQRLAGKEIEVLCAERDQAEGRTGGANGADLDALLRQESALQAALAESEEDIRKLEELLTKIDREIATLCQA
jgi:chromosome segregation ATPase